MLKLTVKKGEYILIGGEVKIAFVGGSSNNMHILVDAPKSVNIVREQALEKAGLADPGKKVKFYKDRDLSKDAKEKIQSIIVADRKKARQAEVKA